MKRFLKNIAYAAAFPIYSLFSGRFGFTVYLPGRGGWWAFTRGKLFPVREPRVWCLEYFRRFVPAPGGIVFDVGGELGYETAQFSRMVGPTGRVLVFECMPGHLRRLHEIAARRSNVTVVEEACWNQTTKLQFFSGLTPGSNTAVPDATGQRGQALADPNGEKYEVQADTLDNQWKKYTGSAPVEFLKMDIEGAEYEALEGAREMLGHVRQAVIAAYHLRDGRRTADRVAAMLTAAGFETEIGENHHVYARRKVVTG
jgi:FkbM family methyltransferase